MSLVIPLLTAFLIYWNRIYPNLREACSVIGATALFVNIAILYKNFDFNQTNYIMEFGKFIENIPFAFHVEPLGLLFALIASGLWIPTTFYAIGYMRGNNEEHQTRFFIYFAVSIAAVMGLAFSANLLTLFVFYEILTLSTYPLVTHKGNTAAKAAGRKYLGILMSTSVGFLLLAIMWTYSLTGNVEFLPGGIFTEDVDKKTLIILYTLFMFGVGKAALMPFHKWLPAAMVAPTPVSALLHAVAVVKAGVFSVMKISIYTFGIDTLNASNASEIIMWVAAATIILSSLIALSKDNLKARLAYSTISQLSYVVLGAAMATSMSMLGGSMHIAMHAVGKITLFFCAGAIYTAAHKTEISEMNGLGKKMPITFIAFFIGACSIIGLPPAGGAWSKFYLMIGAADAGEQLMIAVLIISSLLNIAYLMPIPIRAFFANEITEQKVPFKWSSIKEAPAFCLVPLCITAIGSIAISFALPSLLNCIQEMLP